MKKKPRTTISKKYLNEILMDHELWTTTVNQGKPAVFENIDFQDHDLSGLSLLSTSFLNCDLLNVNLLGSTLEGAVLNGNTMPDISWIKPGKLVKLCYIRDPGFILRQETLWHNFYEVYTPIDELQDYGTILALNKFSFNMIVKDKILTRIPNWVLYTGLLKP